MREAGVQSLQPMVKELSKAEALALAAPNDALAWVSLSTLLRQAFRTQESARAAWHAVELESTFVTWTNLGDTLSQGDVFMSMGGAMGAFQAFKMAARQAKDSASKQQAAASFLNLAYRDFQMGHDEQALELIDEAERLAPELPLIYYNRAAVMSVAGQQAPAKMEAQKALDLMAKQKPLNKELAQAQSRAADIVTGTPVVRPVVQQMGETLPERFWGKPPTRGESLSLPVDPFSTRYFPLVSGVTMRLQVPTNWAHKLKATDKAVHVRMAPAAGEQQFFLQITLFPVLRENFNLQDAAAAGRNGAQAPDTTVGPLLPIERKDGFAFWFDAVDSPRERDPAAARHQYKHLTQLFAYARPFVLSATLLAKRQDDSAKDALLQMARSFAVFRLDPSDRRDEAKR